MTLEQRLLELVAEIGADVKALYVLSDGTIKSSVTPSDGEVLEYSEVDGQWIPTDHTRKLYLDGGNF